MFVILTTLPLNDGTKGFRFNILGVKGLVRKRKNKKKDRKWFVRTQGATHNWYDFNKVTVYFEHSRSTNPLHHFAG
tara:strand:+ start:480 stop:707 length:228 start_codon:yes stop_codon:yes gene_type:complete